jgi:hypothetical protein
VLRAACWVLSHARPALNFANRGVGGSQHSALSTQHLPLTKYLVLAALVLLAPEAFACAVCYGNPGDPMVKGMNNGIWVLLGLVGFVQIGFVAMFWGFWRRARDQRRFRESLRVLEGGQHR